jgi:hypothetical protein
MQINNPLDFVDEDYFRTLDINNDEIKKQGRNKKYDWYRK